MEGSPRAGRREERPPSSQIERATIHALPLEILEWIFVLIRDSSPRREAASLSLVCASWLQLSDHLLWQNLFLQRLRLNGESSPLEAPSEQIAGLVASRADDWRNRYLQLAANTFSNLLDGSSVTRSFRLPETYGVHACSLREAAIDLLNGVVLLIHFDTLSSEEIAIGRNQAKKMFFGVDGHLLINLESDRLACWSLGKIGPVNKWQTKEGKYDQIHEIVGSAGDWMVARRVEKRSNRKERGYCFLSIENGEPLKKESRVAKTIAEARVIPGASTPLLLGRPFDADLKLLKVWQIRFTNKGRPRLKKVAEIISETLIQIIPGRTSDYAVTLFQQGEELNVARLVRDKKGSLNKPIYGTGRATEIKVFPLRRKFAQWQPASQFNAHWQITQWLGAALSEKVVVVSLDTTKQMFHVSLFEEQDEGFRRTQQFQIASPTAVNQFSFAETIDLKEHGALFLFATLADNVIYWPLLSTDEGVSESFKAEHLRPRALLSAPIGVERFQLIRDLNLTTFVFRAGGLDWVTFGDLRIPLRALEEPPRGEREEREKRKGDE